jgi:hypothetical protein
MPLSDDGTITVPKPSFSLVIPTWGGADALAKTLQTTVVQSSPARDYDVEILVIGDGFEQSVKNLLDEFAHAVRKQGLRIYPWYFALREHVGNGNFPRREGLKKATKDWVIFIDTGTALTHRALEFIHRALDQNPDAKFVTWDMAQRMCPVPVMTTVYSVVNTPRTNGLPYVLPGCATAVRRDCAQKVEWPCDQRASDWAFFSQVWANEFGTGEFERLEDINRQVVLIPSTLTIAYAYTPEPKWRWPMTPDEYLAEGFDKGYVNASSLTDSQLIPDAAE